MSQAAKRGRRNNDNRGPGFGAKLLMLVAGLGGSMVVGVVLLMGMLSGVAQSRCEGSASAASEGIPDPPTLEAMEIAERVYDVGRDMNVPYPKFVLAAFATVIVEAGGNTTMGNPTGGDRDSVGAFQQRNFSPWTDKGRNRMNVRDAARTFYEQALKVQGEEWMSIGRLAQEVQISAYPDKYDAVVNVAEDFLRRVEQRKAQEGWGDGRPGVTDNGLRGSGTEKLIMPVPGALMVSPFGQRWGRLHAGIDLAIPTGTPIKAAASGVITLQGEVSGYGNYTCIRHNAKLSTCYAHQSRYGRFRQGNAINQGDVLGYVGCTGHCYGDHLHFETREGPVSSSPPVDPARYLGTAITATGEGGSVPTSGDPAVCVDPSGVPSEEGQYAWPVDGGELIQGSNSDGTHSPGKSPDNWQSDNALDIGVPYGSRVYAAESGKILGPPETGFGDTHERGATEGIRFTLEVDGNKIFYHHLSLLTKGIKPGVRVRRHQLVGYSGKANKVGHLHIAVEHGKPEVLFGLEGDTANVGAGSSIAYVGDSLGVGTVPYLKRAMPKARIREDVSTGRMSLEGVAALTKLMAESSDYDAVVFDLGTNDGSAADLRSSLRAAVKLAGARPLVIATVNGPRAGSKNDVIRDFKERSGVIVVKWAEFWDDKGIHATAAGYEDRAGMFAKALR